MSKLSQEDKSCAVFIQNLKQDVTLDELYVTFRNYGKVKNIILVKSKSKATVIFEKDSSAKEAIRMGNHLQIQGKEILVSKVFEDDELAQMRNYNLFIKNVPKNLETNLLLNYLTSKFGDVISLILKKNQAGQNKGYGYVQFDKIASFENILKYQSQQEHEKITLPNSDMSFTVEPFGRPVKSMNNAKIMGFFEQLVPNSEKAIKEAKIQKVMEEILEESMKIKSQSEGVKMKFFFQYKEEKQNFWGSIDFSALNEETEETVELLIKKHIRKNFGQAPKITFKGSFSDERNITVYTLKDHVTNQFMVEWLAKNLNIQLLEANIRIFTSKQRGGYSQRKILSKCVISFDTFKQGQELLIFAAQRINKEVVAEITEDLHQFTVKISQNEVKETEKHQKKMNELQNPVIMKQTDDGVIDPSVNFNQYFQAEKPGPRQFPPFQFPQGSMPFPLQMMPFQQMPPYPFQVQQPTTPIQVQDPLSDFTQYMSLNKEEQARQVNSIAVMLVTHKNQFRKLKVEDKNKLLGQIIYNKINNFDQIKNPLVFTVFKDQSLEKALAQLKHFKSKAAWITPMLIDTEVLETDEIIDIISDDIKLFGRCQEALELIQSHIDSNTTPQ